MIVAVPRARATMFGRDKLTWTNRMDDALCDAMADGCSFGEAGKRIGVTRDQASSRFHRICRAKGPQAS